MLKHLQKVLFVLIVGAAFILRFHQYEQFPIVGESADEFSWTMLGSSLIQEGKPISWSLFELYKPYWITEERTFNIGTGQKYPLVTPVFDHPPFFSLIPGLAHTVRGQNWQEPASAKVMRLPMVLIGVLNVIILYFVSRKLFDKTIYFYIPVIVYATAPLFVFSSRLVVAENVLTTLILLTILTLISNISQKKQFVLLSILSCVAILIKIAGVLVPVTLIIYGITQKKPTWKAGVIGILSGFSLFAAYGAFYNWQLFVEVFTTQATRGFGFLTLHNRWFLHPAVVTRLFVDGWLISGIVAAFLLIYDDKKKFLPVTLFFILNLLFILFFVGEQTHYSWYDFPVFPLCAIALGYVVSNIFVNKKYLVFSLFWFLLLPTFRMCLINMGIYYPALEISTWIGRAFVGLGLFPWLLEQLWPSKNWAQKALLTLLIAILIANILTILTFKQDLYWATDTYLFERGYIFPQ